MTYYQQALRYEGCLYGSVKDGIVLDCSGLVNLATGQKNRVWHTGLNIPPPGRWMFMELPKGDVFTVMARMGDLFVWKGHCAFYGGGDRLFHARRPGTLVGFTNDLKLYWLKEKGYPKVYRQVA